jgi:hypothetical protein
MQPVKRTSVTIRMLRAQSTVVALFSREKYRGWKSFFYFNLCRRFVFYLSVTCARQYSIEFNFFLSNVQKGGFANSRLPGQSSYILFAGGFAS